MADKITFSKKINDSVQVGDELWYSDIISGVASSPTLIGVITEIGEKHIEVGGEINGVAQTLNTPVPFVAGSGEFIINSEFDDSSNWNEGAGWNITGGQAEHTGVTAGFLDGSLTSNFIEGETYKIEMDVISNTGDILLANVGPYTYGTGYANVEVVIDTTVTPNKGTAEWTQNDINLDKIRIYKGANKDCVIDNVSIIDPSTAQTLFFMFRKPVGENVSSLKGYYAEATFTNSSPNKQELFAVGSEVTMSSK